MFNLKWIMENFEISWKEWEEKVRNYFRSLGYKVSSQRIKGKSGLIKQIDVWGEKNGEKIYCECKDWKNPVGRNTLKEVRDSAEDVGATKIFVASKVGFQNPAKEYAQYHGITLLDKTMILEKINLNYPNSFNEWLEEFKNLDEFGQFFKCIEGIVNSGIDKKLNFFFQNESKLDRLKLILPEEVYKDIFRDLIDQDTAYLKKLLLILDVWEDGMFSYRKAQEVLISLIETLRGKLNEINNKLLKNGIKLKILNGTDEWVPSPDGLKLFIFGIKNLVENKFFTLFSYEWDWRKTEMKRLEEKYGNNWQQIDKEFNQLALEKLRQNLHELLEDPKKKEIYNIFLGIDISVFLEKFPTKEKGNESWLSKYSRRHDRYYSYIKTMYDNIKIYDSKISNIINSIPA